MTLYARYLAGTRHGTCCKTTQRTWYGIRNEKMPVLPPLSQCFLLYRRSCVFDRFLLDALSGPEAPVVLNLGCGLDDRKERCGANGCTWYDLDQEEIIGLRKKYQIGTGWGRTISADLRDVSWIKKIEGGKSAVVIAEGVLMYLENAEILRLFSSLSDRFENISMLFDAYTSFGKRLAAASCPQLGIRSGMDDVRAYETGRLVFSQEMDIRSNDGMKNMPAGIRLAAGITSFLRPERIVFRIVNYVK